MKFEMSHAQMPSIQILPASSVGWQICEEVKSSLTCSFIVLTGNATSDDLEAIQRCTLFINLVFDINQ